MKRFWTVMLTYLRRWQFWLFLFIWGSQLAGLAPSLWKRVAANRFLGASVGFGVGYVCAAIGIHLKEQLGAYRADLTPNFRMPHLAIALAWVGFVVLPYPVIAGICGASVLGVAGPVVLVAALSLSAFSRGGIYAVGAFTVYIAMFVPSSAEALCRMASGDYRFVALAFLLTGLTVLGSTIRFLLTMKEGSPGYATQFRGGLNYARGPQARRAGVEAFRRLDDTNSVWLKLIDWSMRGGTPCVANSRWRRIIHWRRANPNDWVALFMPCLIWLLMVAIGWGLRTDGPDATTIFRNTMWVVILMPQMLLLGFGQARMGMVSREMTYPVRRRDLIIEQGLAIMVSQFLAWGLLMVAMVTVFAVYDGVLPGHFMITTIAVSGAWQLLTLGLCARLAPLSSWVPLLISLALNIGLGTAALSLSLHFYTATLLTCVVGIILILAAVSLFAAYSHWLTVDLPR